LDLEASTPDRFAGFGSSKKIMQNQNEGPATSRPISFSLPRTTTGLSEKFLESGFSSRVKELTSDIGQKANLAREVVKDFQERKEQVSEDARRDVKEYGDRAENLETTFGERVKDLTSDIGHKAQETQEAVLARQRQEVEEVGREARDYATRFERTVSGKFKGPIPINLSGTTATSSADSKQN
jgi:vacuolar-type H+-ATPase subunit H